MKQQTELLNDLRRTAEALEDTLKADGYTYGERQVVSDHLTAVLRYCTLHVPATPAQPGTNEA